MPDFGLKFHFGRLIGVLRGQDNVYLKESAFIGSIIGPLDVSFPVTEVAVEEANPYCRFLRLNNRNFTVLANSSNSFLIRSQFFCILISYFKIIKNLKSQHQSHSPKNFFLSAASSTKGSKKQHVIVHNKKVDLKPIEFRSQNAISFFEANYNHMKKKESTSNSGSSRSQQNLLFKLVSQNYERKNIDSAMISTINNFILNFGEDLAKNGVTSTPESLKLCIDIIVAFQSNLADDSNRHTCSLEEIVHFFSNLILFLDKVSIAWKDMDKFVHSDLINVIWFLLSGKGDQNRLPPSDKKMESLNFLVKSGEGFKLDKLNLDPIIKDSFSLSCMVPDRKHQIKNLFISFLMDSSQISNFKGLMENYLNQSLLTNHMIHFRQAIRIYQRIGASFEERRFNIEQFTFKVLQSNYNFTYASQMNEVYAFSKLFTSQSSLRAIVRTLQKIVEKANGNTYPVKVLEQISQLSSSEIDNIAFDKIELKADIFLIRIIEWIVNKGYKKDDYEIKEKALLQAEQKQEKLIQFVKKLSSKVGMEQTEPQNNEQLIKVCNSVSIIVKNLIKKDKFKAKNTNITLQSLPFLRSDRIGNQAVKNFAVDIVPCLLHQFVPIKQKSPLICAIVLKRAEMQVQKLSDINSKVIQEYFNQAYFQLMHPDSLNFHFVQCFIFMKYLAEKQVATNIITEQILKDLSKEGKSKSNRNLIINLSLLLKILHPVSNSLPVKFKIRQLIKSPEMLAQRLDINQLIIVWSKQLGILRISNYEVPRRCLDIHLKLNEQLQNYNKDFVTTFYSLIIGISDIIQQSDNNLQDKSSLLVEIKYIRKISFLSETYTLIRCFIERALQWTESGVIQQKNIPIFLLLAKLCLEIKSKASLESLEDLDLFIQTIKNYILIINSGFSFDLLITLDHFKSNKNQYREEKFYEYLTSKNFIRFYSQSMQDKNATQIILMRIALKLFKRAIQAKGQSFQFVQQPIRILFLIYIYEQSPAEFKFTQKYEQHLKQYLLLLILSGKMDQKAQLTPIIQKLKANPTTIKQLVLNKHLVNYVYEFKNKVPFNFIDFCLKIIINIFSSYQKQDVQLFRFVAFLIEDDKKDNCRCLYDVLREKLQIQLDQSYISLIVRRIQLGLQLDQKRKTQFLADSITLYELLGRALERGQLLSLVQEIVQIDYYSQCDRSAFLLKEIANIFSVVEQKSSSICETIFNYILTLAQIFAGQQKLEIANFICSFFGLSTGNQDGSFEYLQKQAPLQCSNICNYKCLKCDDKRLLLCLACAVTCHKDHPVCYLNIPPELKLTRCQCRQIPNCCKYNKDLSNENKLAQNNRYKMDFPPPINYPSSYLSGPNRQFIERIKYGVPRPPRPQDPFSSSINRYEYNNYIQQQEYDRMDQELGNQRYYQMMKDQFVPRIGSRLDRIFDRDDVHPQAYRIQMDQNRSQQNNPFVSNPFLREKDKEKQVKEDSGEPVEPEFIDENYQKDPLKMEIQDSSEVSENETILKKYALLPKFIELMINFCSKKATKDKNVLNLELWSPAFTNPTIQRLMPVSFRLSNPGSFHMQVRRQNPLNNVSCVLIKRNLAFTPHYVIIASGTDMQIFSKDRLLALASQGKSQGYTSIHRHSVSYQIHSVEVSPADKTILCATGLHNLALFNINNDGSIGRTQNRYNINNLYINKIKLTKMGIFVGVQKEIRVLNYTCKQFLTIKAQESNTLIRQWAIYQKAAGCQVYFVCPNGNIFFTDVLPSDQGRKEFTGRINDQRKSKNSTGASVFVKDLPDIGKQLFASFKDGYNILGRLEGDQMENMTDVRLKGIKVQKNIFDTFFIVGHVDLVKLPQIDDVFLICTVKKYFPPEMAFHQGFLAAIRFKKDGNTDIQILNEQITCETFQVFNVANKHFFIVSLHTDGSLHLNSPTKIPRAVVEEELRRLRQSDQGIVSNLNDSQPDATDKMRKTLEKQLKFDKIKLTNIGNNYMFRENSDCLKLGTQYALIKLSQNQYELKQLAFGKIITGISLPHYGAVQLSTRRIENTFEIGLTYSQSLYFFANGTFRFKYFKNQAQRYTREVLQFSNNRILEKIERYSEYPEHERLINSSMMNNFLNIKEDSNLDIVFVGKTFESFKTKITKFDEYFSVQSDDESSSIEKTALIIKMFLSKGLKEGNFCEKQQILNLVQSLAQIVAEVNRKLFKLLKEIIVVAMKVYEKLIDRKLNIYTEENYGLRVATEGRLVHFYALLKLDIGDEQLNELLQLMIEIIDEDLTLFSFYCAKYSGLLTQIYRRLKRADTEIRAQYLVKIYAIGYPVLVYCDIQCNWITTAIPQIVYTYVTSKDVRQSLYDGLRLCKFLQLQPALKGLGSKDNEVQDMDLGKNAQSGLVEQEGKDPMAEIYMMFSRGEIDQDAMLRMIQDATKLEYEKAQEINQKGPEQNENIQPQLQMEMEEDIQQVDKSKILIFDLIEDCTENFQGDLEQIFSRIVTLYVISKVVDGHFNDEFDHLMERIQKMMQEIDLKWEGDKLTAVLSYSCLFNRIITTSQYLKAIKYGQSVQYKRINQKISQKLAHLQFEKIQKIKTPVNLLPRVFRGEKQLPQANIAYAFVNLLLYPCQPSHVLLSLECYWLLPDSKQSYKKQKCESSIRDGINSGNLAKVYEIAKQNPQIWQQSSQYLEFIQKWIEEKKNNWEIALELLAIFYEN